MGMEELKRLRAPTYGVWAKWLKHQEKVHYLRIAEHDWSKEGEIAVQAFHLFEEFELRLALEAAARKSED